MTVEFRHLADELRAAPEGDGMTLTGYAARFNSRSEDMGFRETIEPGAFSRSLKSRNDVKALVNHDTSMVIGSTRAGTLTLTEDDRGLMDTVALPDTSYGRDLAVVVKRGDVNAQSFGFSVVKDEWSKDYSERRLLEVRLHEVSIVTFPAYKATSATVRAIARLAHRTEQDPEALADAVVALESGAELTEAQASLLMESIDRSRAKGDEPAAAPTVPASLQAKVLDLAAKAL
jgi:HK97 family phage prohead protease